VIRKTGGSVKLLGHESIRTTEKHYVESLHPRQNRLDSLVVGTWATAKMQAKK
jgi:integrase/recombinase XerD